LTNLTRVDGVLYDETFEGFDRLSEDEWVSDKGASSDVPKLLSDKNKQLSNLSSLKYSDDSSISVETEHLYPPAFDNNDVDPEMPLSSAVLDDLSPPSRVMSMSQRQSSSAAQAYDLGVHDYDDDCSSSIGDYLPRVV